MRLSTFQIFREIDSEAAGLITLNQEQLDQLHQTILPMADDIIELCRENGLRVYLFAGTALGAYRENGFIPWDDDMDLVMPRTDYERFLPLFTKQFGDRYWVHSPEYTHNYGFPNAHIRKKGTKVKTKSDLFDDTEAGANIDVFVAENTYNSKGMRLVHGFLCQSCGLMLSCRRFFRDRKELLTIAEYSPSIRKTFRTKIFLGWMTSFFSIDQWNKITKSVQAMCKNDQTRYVVIPNGRVRFREIYCREQLIGDRTALFEGRSWPVPNDLEYHLSFLYGEDYMKRPPEDRREKHICWAFDLGNQDNKEII